MAREIDVKSAKNETSDARANARARRAREREGATGVYERGFARDVFEI